MKTYKFSEEQFIETNMKLMMENKMKKTKEINEKKSESKHEDIIPKVTGSSVCELCEIYLDVPGHFKIYQTCPMLADRMLVTLTNGKDMITYVAHYIPSQKYVFRNKINIILLTTTSEFYNC